MSKNTRRTGRAIQILDPLTEVYSRVSLDTRLEEEVARAQRYAHPFSLLMIDLDHFKSINDGFSHARGDAALVEFVHRIKQGTRRGDLIFRLGGDEFILLLPNTGRAEATQLAQRLVESVRAKPFAGDPPISLTVSIGVACFPVDGRLPDELMRTAEQHAYQAKRLGRDRVADATPLATGEPSFDVISRLIERDVAQERLLHFINGLPRQSRSLLRVSGAPGYGQSRFLIEVEKMARLRGYAVLVLRGSPALQLRLFGVICEAQGMDGLPHPAAGISPYATALRQRIAQEGWSGLVIVVDDLMYIDRASQEFLQALYFANELPQLALAFADQAAGARLDFLHEVARPLSIDLQPFTAQGVRLWLRHTLQWEAPQDFVDWLHAETGGRPAVLKRYTSLLVSQNLLRRQAEGWVQAPAFTLDAHLPKTPDSESFLSHLSTQPGDFIGREAELRQIKRQLAERRMVCILGPGGLGKTRLSLQVALESQDAYRDGVFFLPLAPLASSEYLLTALTDTLRIALKPSSDPHADLLAHLKSKELLLILDGFENLLDGTALLAEIFEHSLGVRLLVTSRQRLETSLGAVIQLSGLDFPENDAVALPEAYPAVQLFLHDAHLARYQGYPQPLDWTDRQQAAAVTRICRLLRGIPLGLELAAAWSDSVSLPEIAESIECSQEFLLAENGAQESAQHSLNVVFETFWGSLSEYEQGILRQLAVFRGGFSLEAAQQVAGTSPFFLYALAAQSYLRRSSKGFASSLGGEAVARASGATLGSSSLRYETHLLLQQYALERLQNQPDQEAQTRLRHCHYYTDYLQQRGDRLQRERLAQQEIRLELDNIRLAWRYACENCMAACIERCLDTLVDFCAFSGLLLEGQQALQLAMGCAGQQYAAHPTPESAALLARLYAHLGRLYGLTANYARATELAAQAGALAREHHLAAVEGYAELVIGIARLGLAEHSAARQHLQHGLELAQAAGDRCLEADCLRNLGNVEVDISDGEASLQYYQRSMELCQALGDRRGEGGSLNNLGLVATYRDDYEVAEVYFQQFLEIARQVGDAIGEGTALLNLAIVATTTYHFASGREYAESAITLLESIGARYDALYAVWAMAFLEMSQGDLLACQLRYEDVLRRSGEIGDGVAHARILLDVAQLNNRLADYPHAVTLAQEALQMGRDLSLSDVIGHAQDLIGFASLAQGEDPEGVEQGYREAAQVWRQEGHSNLLMESLAGLALAALRRGDHSQALEQVNAILAYLEQGSLIGALEPANVYLACCQVLSATQDPRLPQVLSMGKAWLMEKADLQTNPALRRMFLEDIPLHRQLLGYEG
ncbi:MAG: diguanylate cyclase [Chloroflexota bacterium]